MIKRLFRPSGEFKLIDDYTISRNYQLGNQKITFFSLGTDTDISQERHNQSYLYYVLGGQGLYNLDKGQYELKANDCFYSEINQLIGFETEVGLLYLTMEIEGVGMNEKLQAGEIIKLANLIDYQDESIVNLDVVANDKMKFVVMAFDAGCALDPHRAPGDALVFALEGEGKITYENEEFILKEGDCFRFDKEGLHAVEAISKFKMALLLVLE